MTEIGFTKAIEDVLLAVSKGAPFLYATQLDSALGHGLVVKLDEDYIDYEPPLPGLVRNASYRFELTDEGLEVLLSMDERKEAQ